MSSSSSSSTSSSSSSTVSHKKRKIDPDPAAIEKVKSILEFNKKKTKANGNNNAGVAKNGDNDGSGSSMLKWDKSSWSMWTKCSSENVIERTPFVALKVPVSEIYETEVEEKDLFTVDKFCESLQKRNLFCGMVVDAVADQNAYIYYRHELFDDWDMEREVCPIEKQQMENLDSKLFRFVAPSRVQVESFIQRVKQKLSEDPESTIGVMSLYGYNRAGVLIVSYLVMAKKMKLNEALDLFAQHRPPGIYSKSCLLALQRRLAPHLTIKAPAAPEWDAYAKEVGAAYAQLTSLPAVAASSNNGGGGGAMKPPQAKENTTSSSMPPPAPKPPAPWQAAWSKREQRYFFFHPQTKKSVWKIEECT